MNKLIKKVIINQIKNLSADYKLDMKNLFLTDSNAVVIIYSKKLDVTPTLMMGIEFCDEGININMSRFYNLLLTEKMIEDVTLCFDEEEAFLTNEIKEFCFLRDYFRSFQKMTDRLMEL